MDKPWFELDPNNFNNRWWLYSSIKNTQTDSIEKTDENIICHLIVQDTNMVGHKFYRFSTWYKDDPNRYMSIKYDTNWGMNKTIKDLTDIKEGDILIKDNIKFNVYKCKYGSPGQVEFCKILERIVEEGE